MNNKKIIIFLIIVVAAILVAFYYQSQMQTEPTNNKNNTTTKKVNTEKVKTTDGKKHTVPLDEIRSGGPPKDGIPSIDNPKYISPEKADFLSEDSQGISVSINGVDRFYPYQILVWHEIVNDKINGERILVTYCPLCRSGVVYEPKVKGEKVEFGTSGKLWQSNLVMYDRKTDSLWSQILGQAIVGEMAGTKLEKLPSNITKFGPWKKQHPDGQVLSKDTGYSRDYDSSPYGNYANNERTIFPVKHQDDRLDKKDLILGVTIDGKAKAYYPPAIKEEGRVEDEFQGQKIIAEFDQQEEIVKLYTKKDGKKVRLPTISSFWFSWVAAYPNTKLYK
ncbi:MAG: DUF3179 domain-containing protein [Candidatus Paceibacteria bacterium]